MAGGYTTSMLASMRHAVDVSNIRAILHQRQQQQQQEGPHQPRSHEQEGHQHQEQHQQKANSNGVADTNEQTPYRPLTIAEAFRLATFGGSSGKCDIGYNMREFR